MRALVLAAGEGQRLRPLTEKIPKPLLEVGGRPLIHYPLRMLKQAGILEIAINTHHLPDAMVSALGDGGELGIDIHWAPEPALLGTGGPLGGLRTFLRDDTFVIANSDTILDLDLRAALRFHRDQDAVVTLAIAQPENLDYYSRIEADAAARIRRMRLLKSRMPLTFDDFTAPQTDTARLEPFMYCGVIIMEPEALDLIPPTAPWSIMNGLIGPLVRDGEKVAGLIHRNLMRTIDDVAAYEKVRAEFASNPPRLRYLDSD